VWLKKPERRHEIRDFELDCRSLFDVDYRDGHLRVCQHDSSRGKLIVMEHEHLWEKRANVRV